MEMSPYVSLSMGNPVISRRLAILDQDFKMRLYTSRDHRRHRLCIGIIQVRSFSTEIWLRKGLHMLSMGYPVTSCWSAILNSDFKMRLCSSRGHRIHCSCIGIIQVRSFNTEIWLWKGLHMLSMGNPVISRRSAILDPDFKMRLCTSRGHRRHCSCVRLSLIHI